MSPAGSEPARCGECGLQLSEGVCPSCALGELFSGSGSLAVADDEADETLDIEFGRYVLRSKLATGGMGVVYVAEDLELKRTVALKMIRGATFAGESEMARFRIEAEAAAVLDHPNIVPIYEVGQTEGQPFFTMKLIRGESLAARLGRTPGGRVEAVELAGLMAPIARAVQHAHRRGVLHRDLKPGNVLLDATGVPWLTDFGLAKLTAGDGGLTLTSDRLGTPKYMPPEVVDGSARGVSTASDIWALGVMLWEALCGEVPFVGAGAVETMQRIAEAEPGVPKGVKVDGDLLTLARRCLEKDPAKRPESAGFVADELERRLRGEPLLVRKVTTGERLVKWVKRKPALAALAAAVVVGGLSSGSLWMKVESTEYSLTEAQTLWGEAKSMSQATQLAIASRQVIHENPARATLLAVESIEEAERGLGRVLPESASMMFETLQRVGGWDLSPPSVRAKEQNDAWIDVGGAKQYRPRFSPDGRWCVTLNSWVDSGRPGGVVDAVVAGVFDLTATTGGGNTAEWTLWEKPSGRSTVIWLDDSERLVAVDDEGVVNEWIPDLGGGGTGGARVRLVGRLEVGGTRIARSWLRRGEVGGEVEGFVIYEVPRAAGDEATRPPTEGYMERFKLVSGSEGVRVVRGEVRDLPDMMRDNDHWIPSPQFGWLYQNEAEKTTLYRLGVGGEVVDGGVLAEGAPRLVSETIDEGERWLAVVKGGRDVSLYDLGAGSVEEVRASGRTIYSHDVLIQVMGLANDGERLALGGMSREVVVLGLGSEEVPVTRLRTNGVYFYALGFSDDGQWLAAGSRERNASLWRIGDRWTGGEGTELRGLPTAVLGVAFSPGGKNLVATGSGSHYRRWTTREGSEGHLPEVLSVSASRVNDLARSPDGRWLAAAHGARGAGGRERVVRGEPVDVGFVKLVATAGGGEMVLATHEEAATGVAFSTDGRWLASSGRDGAVNVWEMAAVAEAVGSGGEAPVPAFVFDTSMARLEYDRRLAFRPGGVLYCTCGDGILFEWDLKLSDVGEEPAGYGLHSWNYLLPDVEVSPDGRRMAVARHGWDREPREGSTQVGNMVLVFDLLESGEIEPVAEFPAYFLESTKLTFSPDSRWLGAGAAGSGVSVWDLEAEDIVASRVEAPVSAHLMEAVAFSPDGKWLAIGVSDGRICLWDWRGEGDLWTIRTRYSQSSLAWLDETRLASAGSGGGVLVWETDLLKLKALARVSAGRELHSKEYEIFKITKYE